MPLLPSHFSTGVASRYHILIIDDSPDDLRLLVQLLKVRGYQLSIARDGHDGYQRAAVNPPELILLDVFMPRADGFAACRMLKSDTRTRFIPIIFLTAANDIETRLKGFALGAVDFICKPYVADEVLARVSIHIDLAQRLRNATLNGESGRMKTNVLPDKLDSDEVLVNAAKELLTEHIADSLSMAELVSQLGTNERCLNRIFRQHADMTVFAWLREERLRQGKQLLTGTRLDIATIAEQLGYHSQSHFSNAFRERNGVSPREFRAIRD
ncbi:MAG: helix-turn-helix domain-containing protein [Nitrosomonadales bacterium]